MADIQVADYNLWKPGQRGDTAAYLVNPGVVTGPNKATPGQLAHPRPYFVSGTELFVFPVGVEGFESSGSATLGLHKPIGGNTVLGQTIHREEGRITLSGTFPGTSAQDTMVACRNILRGIHPETGMSFFAPGVFEQEQKVLPESWNFSHQEDDRSHSIGYTITLVRIGEGQKAADPRGTPPPTQPGSKKIPYGTPYRTFTVSDGARTLRAVAKVVYGDQSKWQTIVDLNRGELAAFMRGSALNESLGLPSHQLPTYRWPVGTKFRY